VAGGGGGGGRRAGSITKIDENFYKMFVDVNFNAFLNLCSKYLNDNN